MLTRRRERQRIRVVSSSVCVRAIHLLNENRQLCSYFLLILHLLGLPSCTVSQVLVIKLVWQFSAELVCGHRVSSQWGVGLPHVQVQCCCFTSTKTIRTVKDREPRTSTSTFTQLLSSEATCYVLPTDQGDISGLRE